MKKRTLLCVGIAALALTACQNGTKKCTYEEFKTEVVETAKTADAKKVTKMKVSGTYKEDKMSFTYKDGETKIADLTVKEMACYTAIGLLSASIAAVANSEDSTYYIGNGFRVKNDSSVISWDENLHFTYCKGTYDGTKMDLKVSYTYGK